MHQASIMHCATTHQVFIRRCGARGGVWHARMAAKVLSVVLFATGVTASEVSIQLDPFCDNSIRVRLRPAAPQEDPAAAAVSWIGPPSRGGDSVLCLSEACTKSESSSGYTKGVAEGYAPGTAAPPNSTIELAVYYQRQHTDNLVGPANSAWAQHEQCHQHSFGCPPVF